MILGKSPEVKKQAKQEKIKTMINGVKGFAYFPTQLTDGTWIWLQPFWSYYHGGMHPDGSYFLWSASPDFYHPHRRLYPDQSPSYVSLTEKASSKASFTTD